MFFLVIGLTLSNERPACAGYQHVSPIHRRRFAMKVNPGRNLLTPIILLILVMLTLSLAMPTQPTLAARPPTKTPTLTPAPTTPAPGAVWSIGTLNDSAAEFTGSVGTFTVGVSPTSAFPARLSGANTTQTIIFNM